MIALRRFGLVALAICATSTSSCVVCGDYEHLRFDATPEIAVLKTGVPNPAYKRDVKPFPVSYGVERGAYKIAIDADEYAKASAWITLQAPAALVLRTKAVPVGSREQACVVHSGPGRKIGLTWYDWAGCGTTGILSVSVMDENGIEVGVEDLHLSVVTNGRSCVRDGL